MEQKKTLWIIAAAGVFLLVVLATAGIMYSPAKNQEQAIRTTVSYSKNNENSNDTGWINNQENSSTEKKDFIVFSENTTVYELAGKNQKNNDFVNESPKSVSEVQQPVSDSNTIDLNLLKNDLLAQNQPREPQQNINITVNVPANKSENSENKSVNQLQTPEQVSKADKTVLENDYYVGTSSVKKDSKPAPQEQVQPQPVKVAKTEPAKAKPVSKPVAKSTSNTAKTVSTTQENLVTQYWVQVASYSNKKGAESARSVLDSNKIPADVFTYVDNKENMFFRVRVGPYTTKSEAEYWRSKINNINEFAKAESYVTSTKS
ncbi:MAG: SPOR domain-containing protein [Spirochaetales bacterium]|nr:SPOR domain-containing protein [Spirochaetales bacterium]MDY5915042.1 SPOR domain-containing protein [Treponema sp.]